MTKSTQDLIDAFNSTELLSGLDDQQIDQIARLSEKIDVARGETLIKEGSESRNLYFVIRGRFVVLSGETPIAIIRGGEPIGELAFFAGGRRTASVVAVRNSTVLKISQKAFDELSLTVPQLTQATLRSLSRRLADATGANLKLRPRPGRTICVMPGAGERLNPAFVSGLRNALAHETDWMVIKRSDCPDAVGTEKAAISAWLEELEHDDKHMVLVCEDPEGQPDWFASLSDNCDTVYVVGTARNAGSEAIPLSPAEEALFRDTLTGNLHLVITRETATTPIANTRAWLEGRPVALHHHLALDTPADFERIARFIRGTAVGVVLCGGGAFGTAHLGALKALHEHGYSFDMIGGTSIGAALAAGMALDMAPDKIIGLCEEIFLKSKAMKRLAVPVHSVLDPSRLDAALQTHLGQTRIEDLPLNFFAVATSLTTNDIHVMRSGSLWKAVRASSALPGVFPPMVTDEGDVLIDGGLIDNVPVNVARELKPGANLVFNLVAPREWRIEATYDALPGRLKTLFQMVVKPKSRRQRFPRMFSVLTRTMIVNSRRLLEHTPMGDDILLQLPTLKRMGFLEWRKGRALFDAAYSEMNAALEAAGNPADTDPATRLDILRRAAAAVNEKSAAGPV